MAQNLFKYIVVFLSAYIIYLILKVFGNPQTQNVEIFKILKNI